MAWKLWLDDDSGKPDMEAWRSPPPNETDWKVAHSTAEAIALIILNDCPIFIDFDHDLGLDADGEPDTAMRLLNIWADYYPDDIEKIEGYHIHSRNPAGSQNIQAFMDSWKRSKNLK